MNLACLSALTGKYAGRLTRSSETIYKLHALNEKLLRGKIARIRGTHRMYYALWSQPGYRIFSIGCTN